ncbi:MAG: hypothetical protein PVI21_01155 [Candidatus Woesebacteria bacterium]|jgi:hypothetical protein
MHLLVKPFMETPSWSIYALFAVAVVVILVISFIVRRSTVNGRVVFKSGYEAINETGEATDPKLDPRNLQIGSRFRYQPGGDVFTIVGIIVLNNGSVSWAHYFAQPDGRQDPEIRRFSFGNSAIVAWESLSSGLVFDDSGVQYGGKSYKRHAAERGSVEYALHGKTWDRGQGESGWLTYRMYVGPDSKEWLMYERPSDSSGWQVYYGCEEPSTHFELI